MPKPLVQAEIISRIFGVGDTAATALKHASFRIEEGEVIALSGPSGSGKSTLLHLIGALDAPTDGTISWPGLGAIGTLRPAKVVNVFQGPSLLPPISVIDNVALPMLLSDMQPEEADASALTALKLLQIEHLATKLPEELSGGEAQRVAIARALAIRPKLILADEPTGQLDSATAAHVIDILLAATRDLHAALVLSTHDPLIATRLPIQWRMDAGVLTTSTVARSASPVAVY